jgi:hypothetical protein
MVKIGEYRVRCPDCYTDLREELEAVLDVMAIMLLILDASPTTNPAEIARRQALSWALKDLPLAHVRALLKTADKQFFVRPGHN